MEKKPLHIGLILKISVFILTIAYFSYLITYQKIDFKSIYGIGIQFISEHTFSFLFVFFLMFLNWGLESSKWFTLSKSIQQQPFILIYKSVLIGLGLGFITPRSIGDYVGRLLVFKPKHRFKLISALLLNRILQLLVTLIAGCIGFLFFQSSLAINTYIIYCLISLLLLLAVIFFRKPIIGKINKVSFIPEKAKKSLNIVQDYPTLIILKSFGFAGLRYCVFLLQFLIVYKTLSPEQSIINLLAATSLVLLFKSVILSINVLNDLGVRELGALTFFGLLSIDSNIILGGSLLIWTINILIPSLVGLVLFFINKRALK